jgi:hypothetical protein
MSDKLKFVDCLIRRYFREPPTNFSLSDIGAQRFSLFQVVASRHEGSSEKLRIEDRVIMSEATSILDLRSSILDLRSSIYILLTYQAATTMPDGARGGLSRRSRCMEYNLVALKQCMTSV